MPDKKSHISEASTQKGTCPVPTVSRLAHDIKNPLNAMVGFTQIMCDMKRENVTIEQMRKWAQIVHDASVDMVKTCERVLDDETSLVPVVKKVDVDFRQFGEKSLGLFQEVAKKKGVALNLDISDNLPPLHTDPVLLNDMLNNMLDNAIKFTPKGGKVNLKGELDLSSNALVLVVQDSGQGIAADVLMAIRRGEQVTTSTDKTKYEGWGFGIRTITENAQKLDCNFSLYCPKDKGTIACLKFKA